jgi:hypothetical protein
MKKKEKKGIIDIDIDIDIKINGDIAQSMIDDAIDQEMFDTLSDEEQEMYGF